MGKLGPFKLQISKYAERLEYAQLDEQRKLALFTGIQLTTRPDGSRRARQTRQDALATARRALAILEQQAAGYTSLTIPAHLQIELEDKRTEVADLENAVRLAAPALDSPEAEASAARYDIYRFLVAPKFLPGKPKNKRWRARASFERADRVLIEIEPGSDLIRLWGIFPHTLTSAHESSDEFEGEALFEQSGRQKGRLNLCGKAKAAVQAGEAVILATRTDEFAQWVFLKPRLQVDPIFQMEILCTVPKDLPPEDRFLRCKAQASDRGRKLDKKKRNILLSDPGKL